MERLSNEKWEEIKENGMEMLRTTIDSLVSQIKDSINNPNDYSKEQIQRLDEELEKWMNVFDEERKKIENLRNKAHNQ